MNHSLEAAYSQKEVVHTQAHHQKGSIPWFAHNFFAPARTAMLRVLENNVLEPSVLEAMAIGGLDCFFPTWRSCEETRYQLWEAFTEVIAQESEY
jgi:hypothetical protein